MNIISVNNVTKSYKNYPKKNHRLIEWASLGYKKCHTTIDILKGINFNVGAGESVGIIGMNGAGKSTLLKIITGTTVAT